MTKMNDLHMVTATALLRGPVARGTRFRSLHHECLRGFHSLDNYRQTPRSSVIQVTKRRYWSYLYETVSWRSPHSSCQGAHRCDRSSRRSCNLDTEVQAKKPSGASGLTIQQYDYRRLCLLR